MTIPPRSGLLCSQIGYDLGLPLRAVVRSSERTFLGNDASWLLLGETGTSPLLQGLVAYWGELWGDHWWVIDFSALPTEGSFRLKIDGAAGGPLTSEPFPVQHCHLWRETVGPVVLDQLEARSRLARNGRGWMDCGSPLREANSHAACLIGLTEFMQHAQIWLTPRRQPPARGAGRVWLRLPGRPPGPGRGVGFRIWRSLA